MFLRAGTPTPTESGRNSDPGSLYGRSPRRNSDGADHDPIDHRPTQSSNSPASIVPFPGPHASQHPMDDTIISPPRSEQSQSTSTRPPSLAHRNQHPDRENDVDLLALVIMVIGPRVYIQNLTFPNRELCENARRAVVSEWASSDDAVIFGQSVFKHQRLQAELRRVIEFLMASGFRIGQGGSLTSS